jgi:hypothetical protein
VLARALIALYPRRWRHRYGAELQALAADRATSRARLLADLARGALDARCHPELAHESGPPQAATRQVLGTMLMAATTVGLVLGGFVKLSEDVSFPGAWLAADLARAGALLVAGAVAAALIGPLLATARQSLADCRGDIWLRLLGVPAAAALWLLGTLLLSAGAGAIHGGWPAGLAFFSWCAFSCILTWGAAHLAGDALRLTPARLPEAFIGRGLRGAVAGAVLALGGVVLWGLLATAHAGFGSAGMGGLALGPVWLALLLAMCAAIAVLWRAASAARSISA